MAPSVRRRPALPLSLCLSLSLSLPLLAVVGAAEPLSHLEAAKRDVKQWEDNLHSLLQVSDGIRPYAYDGGPDPYVSSTYSPHAPPRMGAHPLNSPAYYGTPLHPAQVPDMYHRPYPVGYPYPSAVYNHGFYGAVNPYAPPPYRPTYRAGFPPPYPYARPYPYVRPYPYPHPFAQYPGGYAPPFGGVPVNRQETPTDPPSSSSSSSSSSSPPPPQDTATVVAPSPPLVMATPMDTAMPLTPFSQLEGHETPPHGMDTLDYTRFASRRAGAGGGVAAAAAAARGGAAARHGQHAAVQHRRQSAARPELPGPIVSADGREPQFLSMQPSMLYVDPRMQDAVQNQRPQQQQLQQLWPAAVPGQQMQGFPSQQQQQQQQQQQWQQQRQQMLQEDTAGGQPSPNTGLPAAPGIVTGPARSGPAVYGVPHVADSTLPVRVFTPSSLVPTPEQDQMPANRLRGRR